MVCKGNEIQRRDLRSVLIRARLPEHPRERSESKCLPKAPPRHWQGGIALSGCYSFRRCLEDRFTFYDVPPCPLLKEAKLSFLSHSLSFEAIHCLPNNHFQWLKGKVPGCVITTVVTVTSYHLYNFMGGKVEWKMCHFGETRESHKWNREKSHCYYGNGFTLAAEENHFAKL